MSLLKESIGAGSVIGVEGLLGFWFTNARVHRAYLCTWVDFGGESFACTIET